MIILAMHAALYEAVLAYWSILLYFTVFCTYLVWPRILEAFVPRMQL